MALSSGLWACLWLLAAAAAVPCAVAQEAAAQPKAAADAGSKPRATSSGGSGRLSDQLLKTYLSNEELVAWMTELVAKCSGNARKFSIGESTNGANIWALEISDRPGEPEAEPNFKYLANMHGDEPSGRMLLPMLAEWLCANNGKDPRATRLVRDAHLFLVPTMNPDGFAARRRNNANGVDLNRNFPDPILLAGEPADVLRRPQDDAEPETRAVMALGLERRYAASANLHEGAVVANYPFDGYPDRSSDVRGERNPTPDDATFVWLAKLYAAHHKTMAKSEEFPDGIVNGAQWYPVYSGMQDWNYVAAGTMAITLEVSDNKWRPAQDLPTLWEENREALVELPLAAMFGGVRGNVTAAGSGAPVGATLLVKISATPAAAAAAGASALPVPFYSEPRFGFFSRPLAPGRHTLVVRALGYEEAEVVVDVPSDGSGVVKGIELLPEQLSPGSLVPVIVAGSSDDDSSGGSGGGGSGDDSSGSDSGGSSSSGGSAAGLSTHHASLAAAGGPPKSRAALPILLAHGAVFAAIAGAWACQRFGWIAAIGGYRVRRLGSPPTSRFEV
ncbi:carboxypeptidase D [Raphidocelis subcapitata]|uniref:Carboxypeptidase D n=1 Tax=Raphidocelis subcapitata TaxID=307507 RepID=A0A2V0PI07_9CHLO|nr:carboxypeptidase D [Raphidocelis subcapitata]|eukprot:GBF96907.1 carboxypeptidase D [Raphidocelis subcapitata]